MTWKKERRGQPLVSKTKQGELTSLKALVKATSNGNVVAVWHERLLPSTDLGTVKILEKNKAASKKKKAIK